VSKKKSQNRKQSQKEVTQDHIEQLYLASESVEVDRLLCWFSRNPTNGLCDLATISPVTGVGFAPFGRGFFRHGRSTVR